MNRAERLHGIHACFFDAYGTLFDFASAAKNCDAVPEDKRSALTSLWREKQLNYTWLRSLQGLYVPFDDVTREALEFALDALSLDAAKLKPRLMTLYFELPPFPEVRDVLERLRSSGFKTAILSNGSRSMLESLVSHAGLSGAFDAVLSVDAVGVFKPHPSVYQYALDVLGAPANAVSFQSANGWDAFAASAFGMRVVWCNRNRQKRERLPGEPDFEVETLAELPALLAPPPPIERASPSPPRS